MLEKLPDVIFGTSDIQTSFVNDLPSREILERLEEAYECFQYGFYQACIAMCRSVLEYSLKERLKVLEVPLRVDYMRRGGELAAIIKQAEEIKLLSSGLARNAHEIRERGNSVLHRRSAATRDLCWNTLQKMRHILARLYK